MASLEPSETQLSFAKRLAHSRDPKIRDDTIGTLSQWLAAKADADEGEYLKLWKALFYAMWHADKMPVQQELAFRLAWLLRSLRSQPRLALLYLRTFFLTMQREWMGIDRLRMDKYLSLIRRMVGEGLAYCAASGWDASVTEGFVAILNDVVMSQQPNGIRYHVCDLLLDEVAACTPDIRTPQLMTVLGPFLAHAQKSDDRFVFERVLKEVLQALLVRTVEAQSASKEEEEGDEEENSNSASAAADDHDSDSDAEAVAERKRVAAKLVPLLEDKAARDANAKKAFKTLSLAPLAIRVFSIASGADTQGRHREKLYALHTELVEAALRLGHAKAEAELYPSKEVIKAQAAAVEERRLADAAAVGAKRKAEQEKRAERLRAKKEAKRARIAAEEAEEEDDEEDEGDSEDDEEDDSEMDEDDEEDDSQMDEDDEEDDSEMDEDDEEDDLDDEDDVSDEDDDGDDVSIGSDGGQAAALDALLKSIPTIGNIKAVASTSGKGKAAAQTAAPAAKGKAAPPAPAASSKASKAAPPQAAPSAPAPKKPAAAVAPAPAPAPAAAAPRGILKKPSAPAPAPAPSKAGAAAGKKGKK